jgi:hypothetical protein
MEGSAPYAVPMASATQRKTTAGHITRFFSREALVINIIWIVF